jgi:hypothetical protein
LEWSRRGGSGGRYRNLQDGGCWVLGAGSLSFLLGHRARAGSPHTNNPISAESGSAARPARLPHSDSVRLSFTTKFFHPSIQRRTFDHCPADRGSSGLDGRWKCSLAGLSGTSETLHLVAYRDPISRLRANLASAPSHFEFVPSDRRHTDNGQMSPPMTGGCSFPFAMIEDLNPSIESIADIILGAGQQDIAWTGETSARTWAGCCSEEGHDDGDCCVRTKRTGWV